jgi:hypothetical protein
MVAILTKMVEHDSSVRNSGAVKIGILFHRRKEGGGNTKNNTLIE